MIDYLITFFAVFATELIYTQYLKAYEESQDFIASLWAGVLTFIGSILVVEYEENKWMIVPAVLGAILGTWVGMKLRNYLNREEEEEEETEQD